MKQQKRSCEPVSPDHSSQCKPWLHASNVTIVESTNSQAEGHEYLKKGFRADMDQAGIDVSIYLNDILKNLQEAKRLLRIKSV
jgi:hypothetical protein